MNTSKPFVKKSAVKQILLILFSLLVVAGSVIILDPMAALGMRREDPTDTDPIGGGGNPPTFTAPADGFTWTMDKRFGPDRNLDGMIDYNWDPVTMKYSQAYVYPSGWKVTFDGCQTDNDHTNPTAPAYTYTWKLDGAYVNPTNKCIWTRFFTDQNPHTVRLSVVKDNGEDLVFANGQTFVEQAVVIKDYFIVSIGDSYGSGQGNPDIPLRATNGPFGVGWILDEPARWQDERCHRSAFAGPAQAALALEAADPHSSVTFISFNCSGASINTPRYDDNDPNHNAGTGILGPFRGEVTSIPYSNTFEGYIPSQMDQLRDALVAPSGTAPRQIDALIISGGGNDLRFGSIVQTCVENLDCWNNPLVRLKEHPSDTVSWDLYDLIDRALGRWGSSGPAINLPRNYDLLGAAIDSLSPRPANVYITQYPDPTVADNGETCRLMDDIAWPNPYYQITIPEATVAARFIMPGLNGTLQASVARLATTYTQINWQYVDGLTTFDVDPAVPPGTPGLFVGPPNGPGHGYCASDNWIRRADEAELIQGPVNLRNSTKGLMHPSAGGQQAYKQRILYYMLPDLIAQPLQAPPTFSFFYNSAGLTAQPGLNGWYIQSCDSAGVCYPKVVARAVAQSTIAMNGASILVNDSSGCTGSVACTITPSADAKQVTYNVEISASGTYRFQFNVQDTHGQVSLLQQEIKVDLEDPVLNYPPGCFHEEGSALCELSAYIKVDSNNVPLNGDYIVDFDWDLDNNGTFETEEEHPIFPDQNLDGPGKMNYQVRVTDRAGRTDSEQGTVYAWNAAPVVTITGAPATSPEGKTINLGSTVSDPGVADTFTYAWSVTKDGVSFASGSSSSFSFTPDDNGSYEVSLNVTDDDGGAGSNSQTVSVTNVTPVLSNITVPAAGASENTSFILSGDITETGPADTLDLTIDWGDGGAPESVSLAAGSTGFSRSHTYLDDNPAGTPADSYVVSISLADDDGSTTTSSATVLVNNLAPSVSITAPASGALYAINTPVNLSGTVTDLGINDTLACSVKWDDGTTSAGTISSGVCSSIHAYASAGVYTIQLTAEDDDTGSDTKTVMVVVYDPAAGFVTGGGWIDSPAGAFLADQTLAGRANFGFVSKYQKGATRPAGGTAFQFLAGEFKFYSDSYDWLVVSGARAQFKGTGLVDGALDPNGQAYKFMVWAGDGSGTNGADTFRIRIWWEDGTVEHDVYDNGFDQEIGAGNIVIHTSK